MNSKVDFAAGGIVLIDNKVLLVKNRLRKEYKEYYDSGFWVSQKVIWKKVSHLLKQLRERGF